MHRVRHSTLVRAFLLRFALLLWIAGCMHYVPVQQPYEETIDDHGKVRVTLTDSSTVGMFSPHLEDGSLVGNSIANRSQSVTVPLDEIAHIAAHRTDGTKTALLVVGIVGVLVIAGAIAYSQADLFEGNPLGNFN